MVPDTGSVAKNKTQSGSLFEGCRDVARAPEHNHLTHLFKETETQQLCHKKEQILFFFSIREKIQSRECKRKQYPCQTGLNLRNKPNSWGYGIFQMSRFPRFFFFIRKEKTMVGVIIKTLTNAQTSQQNMCSFCKDKKKKADFCLFSFQDAYRKRLSIQVILIIMFVS